MNCSLEVSHDHFLRVQPARDRQLDDGNDSTGQDYVPSALGADAPRLEISPKYGSDRDPHVGHPGLADHETSGRLGAAGNKFTLKGRTGVDEPAANPRPGVYSPNLDRTCPVSILL